mgnify:CR=1 FL=1
MKVPSFTSLFNYKLQVLFLLVFENKDKIVLVMQYASGGELYDYVSYHKVLSDSDARRLFRQIATAIYYCHKVGTEILYQDFNRLLFSRTKSVTETWN